MVKGVLMVIWVSLVMSVFIYPPFLDGEYPIHLNDTPLRFDWVMVFAFVLILIASAVRWMVIPKLPAIQLTIQFLILGLALSETTVFSKFF